MKKSMDMMHWTLTQWEKAFWDLFKKHDLKRSTSSIWFGTIEYASKIAEAVRKSEHNDLLTFMSHAFCWVIGFAAKCKFDPKIAPLFKTKDYIDDIVAFKYPNACGHCKFSPCTCGLQIRNLESQSDKVPSYEKLLSMRNDFFPDYKNWDIDRWVTMFETIYGNANYAATLETIVFHFLEEVGETVTIIRRLQENRRHPQIRRINPSEFDSIQKMVNLLKNNKIPHGLRKLILDKIKLNIEIADSFSWLCGIFIKLRFMYKGMSKLGGKLPVSFSKMIVTSYKNPKRSNSVFCPRCKRSPCKCTFFL